MTIPREECWDAVGPHVMETTGRSGPEMRVIYVAYVLSLSRNSTRYQHSMALARRFNLQVVLAKGPCPAELAASADVMICPGGSLKFVGRFVYFFCVLVLLARARFRSGQRGSDGRFLLITTHQPLCIMAGILGQRILRVKWVADIFDVPALGLEITQRGRKSWIRRLCSLPRLIITEVSYHVLKSADLVLCTLVPDALARCSIPPERLVALTNGIELRNCAPAVATHVNREDAFEVLYVGAVLRIRGVDTMLDACSLLRGRLPGLRLLLVGPSEPEEQRWLHRRILELGLEAAVSVTGELPHDETIRRVHSADICLFPFPTNYATEFIYPVKVFEYMAAGRATIASDLAGVRRVIEDGRSGVLVEPGNPQALADAIHRLWRCPDLRALLATNARAAVPKFDWQRINGQMLEALHTLIEERQ